MVYQFKIPGLFPVSAQVAGEELSRIYHESGTLEPSQIVDESRDATAPLHPCFEWDDAVAAEKYRECQAGDLVRAIVTVEERNGKQEEYRAFVHVEQTFHPLSVVVASEKKMDELLETALKELRAFRRKYEKLEALRPVFNAIEKVSA